jgi:hypothetical protein
MLTVPYYSNAQKMAISDSKNKTVLEVDLIPFSSQCGDGKCEANENTAQCSQDCSEAKSDNLCTYTKDNVCDPDCMKIDPDCKILSPLIIANIIALAVFILLLIAFLIRK